MSEHPIKTLLDTSMQQIREMVDVDTIIGDPIKVDGDVTIIPISKISFGFASGGSDLPTKADKDLFGGGSGAGISIQPLAFIVIQKGDVKLLQLSSGGGASNAVINMVPDVVDKIAAMFGKDKSDKSDEKSDSTAEK